MPEKSHLLLRIATLSALPMLVATVVFAAPTAVTKDQDLNFGKIAGGGGYSGTVTVSTSGVRSFTGNITPLGTSFASARFTITGNAGKAYIITLPTNFVINAGPDQLTISALTSSIPLTGAIPAGGVLPFAVGATLTISNAQTNSMYSGTFTVSVK